MHRFVKQRTDAVPSASLAVLLVGVGHRMRLLFTTPSPGVAPDGLHRGVMRGRVEPAGKYRHVSQSRSVPGELHEDFLRYILGAMRVAIQRSQSRGINEVHISPHQFGERILRVLVHEPSKQLLVILHFATLDPASRRNRTKNCD